MKEELKNKKLKIMTDGGVFCILLGDDLQEGVSGFGTTLLKAIKNFDKNNK